MLVCSTSIDRNFQRLVVTHVLLPQTLRSMMRCQECGGLGSVVPALKECGSGRAPSLCGFLCEVERLALSLQVWATASPGACLKGKLSGPVPALLSQNLWSWGLRICLTHSLGDFPSNSLGITETDCQRSSQTWPHRLPPLPLSRCWCRRYEGWAPQSSRTDGVLRSQMFHFYC